MRESSSAALLVPFTSPWELVMESPDCFWSPEGPHWREAASRLCCPRNVPTDAQRIPRIIHHIWLGSVIPLRLLRLVRTWKALHPTWSHLLWGDDDISALELCNKRAYDSAHNLGQRSDILRYEVLRALGGTYVDVDVQCVDSIAPLHDTCSFYCGVSNTGVFELNNAVIGSAPQHPCTTALMLAIDATFVCPETVVQEGGDFLDTIEMTGPGLLSRTVMPMLCPTVVHGGDSKYQSSQASMLLTRLGSLSLDMLSRLNRSRESILQHAAKKLLVSAVDVVSESQTNMQDGMIEFLGSSLILPMISFYPLPNSAIFPLPLVAIDDEYWDSVYSSASCCEGQRTRAWLIRAIGVDIASFIPEDFESVSDRPVPSDVLSLQSHMSIVNRCYGVHYWARTWQRLAAQLTVTVRETREVSS